MQTLPFLFEAECFRIINGTNYLILICILLYWRKKSETKVFLDLKYKVFSDSINFYELNK